MRYAKGHKDRSHARILKAAARRFRRRGIAAAGLTEIMAEAALMNGGFYAHFRSKTDLVRQGLDCALHEQLRHFTEAGAAPADLSEMIRAYLSAAHRDRPATGCASAAASRDRPPATRRPQGLHGADSPNSSRR
jgi:TetR/AcrR family transcriptional regulator, transcriptional repressor for nem operon